MALQDVNGRLKWRVRALASSFCLTVLCAASFAQSTSTNPASVTTLNEVQSLFSKAGALDRIIMRGSVTFVDGTTASFKATAIGHTYAFDLTSSSGRQENEKQTGHLGNSVCDHTLDSHTLSSTKNGVCGYPFPWVFATLSLADFHRRDLSLEATKTGPVIAVTIKQGKSVPATYPQPTAALRIDTSTGTLDRYTYSVRDLHNPGNLLHVEVVYSNFVAYRTVLLPHTITRTINGGDPMVMQVQTLEEQN